MNYLGGKLNTLRISRGAGEKFNDYSDMGSRISEDRRFCVLVYSKSNFSGKLNAFLHMLLSGQGVPRPLSAGSFVIDPP